MYFYPKEDNEPHITEDLFDVFQDGHCSPYFQYNVNSILPAQVRRRRSSESKITNMYVFYPSSFTDELVRNILRTHYCSVNDVTSKQLDLKSIRAGHVIHFEPGLHSSHIVYYFHDQSSGLYSFMCPQEYFSVSETIPKLTATFLVLPAPPHNTFPSLPSSFDNPLP